MITVPLFDTSQHPPGTTNSAYLKAHLSGLFAASFPNLTQRNIEGFVASLFANNSDQLAFKNGLRDFLVTLKEFGTDNDELWSDEKEQQKQQLEAAMPAALRPIDPVAQAEEDAAMNEL